MLHRKLRFLASLALFTYLTTAAWAAETQQNAVITPENRAALLQQYREQCNDPNPDVRMAHIEAAVQSNDATRQRICVQLALSSNDSATRNLGLRAAFASAGQISFIPAVPSDIANARKKEAEGEENAYRNIDQNYYLRFFKAIEGGIVFRIEKKDTNTNTANWFPLVNNQQPDKKYFGQAAITGDTVNWSGGILYTNVTDTRCSLTTRLTQEGKLAGKLGCGQCGVYEVTADIF